MEVLGFRGKRVLEEKEEKEICGLASDVGGRK